MKWGSTNKNDDRRYIIKYAWFPTRIVEFSKDELRENKLKKLGI